MSHWLDKIVDLLNADTADLRTLAKIAGGDPRTFYLGTELKGADLRGQDLRGMEFTNLDILTVTIDENTKLNHTFIAEKIEKNIIDIKSMRRQEERLISVIKLYIENPDMTEFIDKYYKDKAKFTRLTIEKFRHRMNNSDLFGEKLSVSKFPEFMDSIINESFPLNRGYVLFYLAKYFGYDKRIITLIRKRLHSNFTMKNHIDGINHLLSEWKIKSINQ